LNKIENKLKLSAQPFGAKADKYVKVVMEGLKILIYNHTDIQPVRKQSDHLSTKPVLYHDNLKSENHTNNVISRSSNDNMINQIVGKVLQIAKNFLIKVKQMEINE
jgi:hypothetical protein